MNNFTTSRNFGNVIIALLFILTRNLIAQTPACTPNTDANSLKEAMQIVVPTTKSEVYFGKDNSKIPTFKEMLGVNFTTGLMNTISTYTGTSYDNKQKSISDVFSHVRYYITCERDLFSDDVGWTRARSKQILAGNLINLNVIVGQDGAPITSSTDPNAIKIYPEIQKDNSIILKQVPAGIYQNPYEHYMNYNYLQIKPAADFYNHGIEATLDVFSGDFPAVDAPKYKFPNAWFLKEDWGPSDLDITLNAKAYAMMLARTYAPKASDCATCKPAIEVLEIGNEPYGYTDPKLYQLIVDAFIDGVNTYYGTETTNKFKLITAAFQAFHTENTLTPTSDEANRKDYINTRIRNDQRCKLDGYNSHIYSFDRQDAGNRPIINPENVTNGTARSEFMNIRNAWRWLKDNPMNQQDLYLTEFGFDSDPCYGGLGLGSITQAVYNIRSILMMQRYGINRAFLYEAVDDPAACGYAFQTCGVWKTDKTSKYQFAALEKFMRIAGDTKFHCCLKEVNNDVNSYILEDKNGVPKYMVAWLAQNINDLTTTKTLAQIIAMNGQGSRSIPLIFDGKTYMPDVSNTAAWCQLDGETSPFVPNSFYDGTNFILSAIPIIIPIKNASIDPCLTDVTSPIFSNCPPTIYTNTTNGVNAIIIWTEPTATDNCGVQTLTSNYNSGVTLPIGTTAVTYTATDYKNNKTTCSFNVVVVDPCIIDVTSPVIINCPQNMSVSSANGINAVVTWTAPTATDNCGVLSFISNLSSGVTLLVGTTVVTYTALDKRNNKATCIFNVNVVDCLNDKTAPVIANCPQNLSFICTNGINAIGTWTAPTATDNCGLQSFNSNFSSGAKFPIGTTLVTYTALDKKNNKSTCSFSIIVPDPCVGDVTLPVINNCPQNISLTSINGINAVATWTAPTATDNCGVQSLTSSLPSGSTFTIGTKAVTYTALDKKNNKSTCTFNVVVTPACKKYTAANSLNQCGCTQNKWSPYGVFLETSATTSCPGTLLYCDQDLIFQYYNDGTANLKGTFRTAIWQPVVIDVVFFGGTTTAPTGSPSLYLCQTGKLTSVAAGWTYFTGMSGTMKFGTDAAVTIAGRNTATQLGIGADEQVTDKLGLSGFFTLSDGRKGDFKLVLSNETPLDCAKNACATDAVPPVIINCPQTLTVNTIGTNVAANWTAPAVSDNCSLPTLTSNYTSGQTFNVGTTGVTYTATDAKNNISTCTFSVVVIKVSNANDLAVSITANPLTISGPNTTITLIVTVNNIGTQVYNNITVNVPFPAGLVTGGTATATNGNWIEWYGSGQVFNWQIPTLAVAGSATLSVPVYVQSLTPTVTASATLTASTPVDALTSNNSAQITLYGTPPIKISADPLALSVNAATQNNSKLITQATKFKNIFPNPSNDFITIELESIESKMMTFYFFDALGKRLKLEDKQINQGNNYLNFSINSFEKGMHFISTDNSGLVNPTGSFLKM